MNDYPDDDSDDIKSVQTQLLPNKHSFSATLSKNQKYRKLIEMGEKLAVAASVCGMVEFTEKYNSLEKILSLWEANTPFVVVPTEENKEVTILLGS